jgi:hypothetical protein
MPAATLTRPTTTPQAPRACWWQIRPEAMPDGRLLGYLGIRMTTTGKAVKDFYRVVREDCDDFCESWRVEKEQADGSFADAYLVTLPVNGCHTRPSCTCKGFVYNRACRHINSLAAALKSL